MPNHLFELLAPAVAKGISDAATKHGLAKMFSSQKSKKHDQKTRQQQQQQQASHVQSGSSGYIYRDVVCDGCDKSLNDKIRYCCLECPNFDLCGNCHRSPSIVTSQGVHYQNHRILKMVQQDEEWVVSA